MFQNIKLRQEPEHCPEDLSSKNANSRYYFPYCYEFVKQPFTKSSADVLPGTKRYSMKQYKRLNLVIHQS